MRLVVGFAFTFIKPFLSTFTFLCLQLNSLNKENLRQRHIIDREAAARKVITSFIIFSLTKKEIFLEQHLFYYSNREAIHEFFVFTSQTD